MRYCSSYVASIHIRCGRLFILARYPLLSSRIFDPRCPLRRFQANTACRILILSEVVTTTPHRRLRAETNFAQHLTGRARRLTHFSVCSNPTLVTFSSFPNSRCVFRPQYHSHLFIFEPPFFLRFQPVSVVLFCIVTPFAALYTKNERGGGRGRKATPAQREESS